MVTGFHVSDRFEPSSADKASTPAAAFPPTAEPAAFAGLSGTAVSASTYQASTCDCWDGVSATSTDLVAESTAASIEASGTGSSLRRAFGKRPVTALTASKTATCTTA